MDTQEIFLLIKNLEDEINTPVARNNPFRLNELIADEFIEIGATGKKWDKGSIVRELLKEENIEINTSNFTVRELSEDLRLAMYLSVKINKSDKTEIKSIRSSIWKFIDGNWKIIFHQGTLIK